MAPIKTILHITPFFRPNIGGVETHLDDLTRELARLNYNNIVLTYSPLTTTTKWKHFESGYNLEIHRFSWFGHNLFHRLEKNPLFNFFYITPYLLFRSIVWQFFNKNNIDVIHSHGINGAIIGNIFKYLFHINKHIVSIYSTYDNVPLNSFSTKMLVFILNHTDIVLTQSDSSVNQLKLLGVSANKLSRYYHWIDLTRFSPDNTALPSIFTILFIGRMIPQKNALLLAKVAQYFPDINFNFIGTGPDYQKINNLNFPNIKLIGDIPYNTLHRHYQQANLLCVPSKYAEGWGRVIAESIACGVPVLCTNLGGTTEAVDKTVAVFITPARQNLITSIKKLSTNKIFYNKLKSHCRRYAISHYSAKNIKYITCHY